MKIKNIFYFFIVIVLAASCKKDDNINIEPPKALSEVIDTDEASIKAYLESHFYNYEEFANPPADFDYRIVLDSIIGDNADKTPLLQMMTAKKVLVRSVEIGLTDDKEVEHTYYYLVAREGSGATSTVADSTFIRYEGSLMNGQIFQPYNVVPEYVNLASFHAPTPITFARGFAELPQYLKAAGSVEVNVDGSYEVNDYGVGIIIFPSALGFYSAAGATTPAYSPMIFKMDLIAVNIADQDGDGVPNYVEDLNKNNYLFDDNTDVKSEESISLTASYNFLDNDDDNDGRLTKDEVTFNNYVVDTNMGEQEPNLAANEYEIDKKSNNGIITIKTVVLTDTNNDGTPDYLDPDN